MGLHKGVAMDTNIYIIKTLLNGIENMKVSRMDKKGILEESNPELDRITTKWNKAFMKTRALRAEIADAQLRLAIASEEFERTDLEWVIYERINGAKK